MTREEILMDYDEVEGGDCCDCDLHNTVICRITWSLCVENDTHFKKRKKEKEKVMSKCTVKFNMPEVIIKIKDIPNDTYFTATTSDGTCTLYLKTEKHVANLSKPYVVSWGIQDEIVNYQPVDVEITVRRCES